MQQRTRLWWSATIMLGGVVLLGMGAWWNMPPAAPPLPPQPDAMAWRGDMPAPAGLDAATPTSAQHLLMQPGDEPIAEEPADLPAPTELANAAGERVAGFMRHQPGVTETFSLWRVERVDVEALASFYNEAARAAGFTPLPTNESSQRSIGRLYHRPTPGEAAGHEVLSVRLTATNLTGSASSADPIRVLVWLRTPTRDVSP